MLHLLPIRILLQVVIGAIGLLVLTALSTGVLPEGDPAAAALVILRWASFATLAVISLSFAAWRWIPAVQAWIFPYIGGVWEGEVRFVQNGQANFRTVKLEAKHTLLAIKLLLESAESESSTLVVHAEKDPHFDRYKLYYVYLNTRKEGVSSPGSAYRGLAIVRCLAGKPPQLEGDYFTETHNRHGTLHLHRVKLTPFWKLWR